jgi:hypothetical protein
MSFKAAMITIASRPAIVSRPAIALATPHTAVVALLAFQKPLELLPVTFFELVAKFALGSRTKLIVLLPLDQVIAEMIEKNTLEVLGKNLQCLVIELVPTVDILHVIRATKRHIEPLNLKSGVGWRMIPLG